MRVFKVPYKTRGGRVKDSKNYYVEVRDHLGKPRKFAGFTEKRLTFALGQQIKTLADYVGAGQPLDSQTCQWLKSIPDRLRLRLAKIGLIDRNRAAAGKPLDEHLADYRVSIGDNTKHARVTYNALIRLFRDCKFVYWHDLQPSRLYNHLMRQKTRGEIAQRTFNRYLKAAKAFCRWMVIDRRAHESPIIHLRPIRITERKIRRKALSFNELIKLLDKTSNGPVRFGMTGYERYLLYRLAIETGLRANEIRSLTVESFDFVNCTVVVEAGYSKHRREDVISLKRNSDLPETLKEFFKSKSPRAKAFGGAYKQLTDRTSEMIRADLKAAKIPYKDEGGRVYDFHSLRHTTGTLLAASGVHPKVAQSVMRHSDINLTMSLYTHTLRGQESEAVENLPDLSLRKAKLDEKAG